MKKRKVQSKDIDNKKKDEESQANGESDTDSDDPSEKNKKPMRGMYQFLIEIVRPLFRYRSD